MDKTGRVLRYLCVLHISKTTGVGEAGQGTAESFSVYFYTILPTFMPFQTDTAI